jgi:hypothetical protein
MLKTCWVSFAISVYIRGYLEVAMTSITNDYTRKIQFAESWLKKAREEFEQGSELTASSHVILAIAEMESLKHSLFPEPIPMQLPDRKQRFVRFDIRPVLAFALLALALGIFSYSYNTENNLVTDKNLNYIASSEISSSPESPSLISPQPALESVIDKLDLLINTNSAPSLNSVVDNQPTTVGNPKPVNKPRSRTRIVSPVRTGELPAVISDPVMPSRNDTKVASAGYDTVLISYPRKFSSRQLSQLERV